MQWSRVFASIESPTSRNARVNVVDAGDRAALRARLHGCVSIESPNANCSPTALSCRPARPLPRHVCGCSRSYDRHRLSILRLSELDSGSVDWCLRETRRRIRSARASCPRRTTDHKYGRRLMPVKQRTPISCRHRCRRKEPLPSSHRSGRPTAGVLRWILRAGRDNFRDNLDFSSVPITRRPVVYLAFSPR